MGDISIQMPLQNESSVPTKVLLEPLSEYFILKPGQKVVVHAVFDGATDNVHFTIAPNDGFLTIYAPGEIAGFGDCYMTCNGVRLTPDGN